MSDSSKNISRIEISVADLGGNYRAVEPMYSLVPEASEGEIALDVINEANSRREYITSEGSPESERMVRDRLGRKAVLARIELPDGLEGSNLVGYSVPRGTRRLSDTLQSAPYSEAYMQRLNDRAERMLVALREIDNRSFGIDIERVAIAHNGTEGDPDDSYLVAIPPLLAPGRVS